MTLQEYFKNCASELKHDCEDLADALGYKDDVVTDAIEEFGLHSLSNDEVNLLNKEAEEAIRRVYADSER